MARKREIGQRIMDLFYQQYKTNSDFFELDDFVFYAGEGFAYLVQQEYEGSYALLRSESATRQTLEMVAFSPEWLSVQELEVKQVGGDFTAELLDHVMGFKYDRNNVGIQNILPIPNSGCGELERTTLAAAGQFCYLPYTRKIWWYLAAAKCNPVLKFLNVGACPLKKVEVTYVPSSNNEDFEIADTRVMDVIQMGLKLFVEAKHGKPVIPAVNDLNKDPIIQNQTVLQPIK